MAPGRARIHGGAAVNALKIAAMGGEAAVLAATATVAYGLVAASGNLLVTAPIIVAATALELTRLPLVMRVGSGKLGFFGAASALVLASCITLVTAETLVLGVDGLLAARSAKTAIAETHLAEVRTAYDAAKADAARRDQERDRLAAGVTAAQKHSEEIGRETVALQGNPSVSAYRGRKGWVAPGSAAANTAAAANARAQAEHARREAAAEADLAAARTALAAVQPIDIKAAEADLVVAQQAVDRERAANPLSRLAASLYSTDVANLRPEDYATVRKAITLSLAFLMAVGTLGAGLISALPDRADRKPSKLVRAFRSLVLARRRRHPVVVRRDVPGPIQYRDRPRFVYVATDDQGRVRNPDDVKP